MSPQDRRWFTRNEALLGPLWAFVQPPGQRVRPLPLRLYAGLMRAHRWLWVRGVEL